MSEEELSSAAQALARGELLLVHSANNAPLDAPDPMAVPLLSALLDDIDDVDPSR